jgi:hypothetical protein
MSSFLELRAYVLKAIHGDKQQNERDWVLNEFKTGKSPIMVATDVASRGIGMIDCEHALPCPPPSPELMLCGSVLFALLSAQFRSVSAIFWSKLVLSWCDSLTKRIMDIRCSVACYAFYAVSLCTIWVQRRVGFFLSFSSCISKDFLNRDES